MGSFFGINTSTSKPFGYTAKESLMTKTEAKVYRTLLDIFKNEYFIFPQVHLSSLVSSKDLGRRWWFAFLHINAKSVDYVFCDPATLKPICAVELDDWSHSLNKRIKRDAEVERILIDAGMPLARIKDPNNINIAGFYEYLERAKAIRGIK